jgi:hypothetical protein
VCSAAALCNSGYKVALIESNSSLGGTTTEGFVSTWIEGVNLDFHVQMFQNLCESGDLIGDVEKSWLPTKFANGKESCIIKLNPYKVAEYYRNYFVAANNIDVYYGYLFENVIKMNGNTISEILVTNEETTYIFTARFFIDASGDGVLCRAASRYISSSEELYFRDFKMPAARVVSFDKISKLEGDYLLNVLLKDGRDNIEVVLHPALVAEYPYFGNVSQKRVQEYQFVSSAAVKDRYESKGIRFVNFDAI